jgi:hypothetical protein
MKLQPVKSSNIVGSGYDPHKQRLLVEFHAGTIYEFVGVEPEIWVEFHNATSAGQFFHREIRSRAVKTAEERTGQQPYLYRQLDDAEVAELRVGTVVGALTD